MDLDQLTERQSGIEISDKNDLDFEIPNAASWRLYKIA